MESRRRAALSQTRELASDLGVLVGAPMDPDLHGRTRPDWHGTTEQMELPPAGPRAQGWTGKCKSGHGPCLAEVWMHPLAIDQDRS
jgi:hypothetical protein